MGGGPVRDVALIGGLESQSFWFTAAAYCGRHVGQDALDVTIELQLEDPPRSRTIWVGEHDGKLYVFSGESLSQH